MDKDMKCTKITLTNRNELASNNKGHLSRQDRSNAFFTTGYHGYSYKLSARTKKQQTIEEPQLTVTTLIFPDNTSFNTGSSLERWSKKTPRLISAKCKNYSPRKSMLDDEYNFSYDFSELIEEKCFEDATVEPPDDNIAFNFDEYYVSSDIEELVLKSQENDTEKSVDKNGNKRIKSKKREKIRIEDGAKKKRHKFKKTIRFSFSKPPSPETEQVIRVDVTSNVSFEEMVQIEKNNLLKNDCSKEHGKFIINARQLLDNNNNDGERVEDDFVLKCRQLALTKKKQR